MSKLCFAQPSNDEDNFCLRLSSNPIRFEPVTSKVTHVFYDDANKQVFSLRGGGATGVVVKGPNGASVSFRIEDKGPVISIKFSPNQSILAIQRSVSSVGEPELVEYSQLCKGKTTKIQGFVWTNLNEVTFVTDHGVEIYQVLPDKKLLKLSKTYAFHVNWFVYQSSDELLLLSLGSLGNQLLPLQFKSGNVYKLPKFEVDLPAAIPARSSQLVLFERDVVLANIYNQNYVIVLRHHPRMSGSSGAEVVLYALQKDSPARKMHVLKLEMSGRFAINVVDNLLIVHNQASKTSAIFDVGLPGQSDGYMSYHHPLTSPLPIKTFKLIVPTVPTRVPQESAEISCELYPYSPNWVVFQPDIIIDAKMGCLWHLQLSLESLIPLISDECKLIDFLLLRNPTFKPVLLKVCCDLLLQVQQPPMLLLACIFDRLNLIYRRVIDLETNSNMMQAVSGSCDGGMARSTMFVDQSDMYTHVFTALADKQEKIANKFLVAALMEYIRSLSQMMIPVQHYLYELVINTLVRHDCFYQLHQLLQYHVLSDSKPLACLMLSLEGVYQPAHQLGLDMLKRLGTANEEIVEVLLSKHQLIPALRFLRCMGDCDTISARKFLEVAMSADDPVTFLSVFKFFEQRNIRLRGKPGFNKGEHCESYVAHYNKLFNGISSVSPELVAT